MEIAACRRVNWMEHEGEELARKLRSGDPEIVERLIEQYQYRLFRYLLSLTGNRPNAEDLFQETWLRVLERGHQYNGRWKFESWLFSVARHLAIDSMRRKKAASLDAFADPGADSGNVAAPREPAAVGASPFDLAAGQEEGARLAAALAQLPAFFREVLVLRFQEDMKLEEIAAVTDAPLSTVKSRLYRGLREFRDLLERPAERGSK